MGVPRMLCALCRSEGTRLPAPRQCRSPNLGATLSTAPLPPTPACHPGRAYGETRDPSLNLRSPTNGSRRPLRLAGTTTVGDPPPNLHTRLSTQSKHSPSGIATMWRCFDRQHPAAYRPLATGPGTDCCGVLNCHPRSPGPCACRRSRFRRRHPSAPDGAPIAKISGCGNTQYLPDTGTDCARG